MSSLFPAAGYGGRAWLAPPPCAPRRPANRAPRAHVRRARHGCLAGPTTSSSSTPSSTRAGGVDHHRRLRPCRPCCQRAFVVLRVWSTPPQTPNRSPGPRRGSLAPRGAPCAGPARCKGGASRAPVSVDLCRLPLESGHASCIHAAGVHTQADVPPLVIKAPATHPHHVN